MNLFRQFIFIVLIVSVIACSEDTVDNYGTGVITGKVVLEGDNSPLENVKVSTSPSSTTVFSDENGDFILNEIVEGDYSVQAQKTGYITGVEGATLKAGQTINVIFELQTETANNKQPSAPELLFPEDEATNQELEIQFAWNSVDKEGDELTYKLELKNSVNSDVITIEDIKDTLYTISELNYGYKYFWQVSASDSINGPVLSKVQTFKTKPLPAYGYVFVREIDGNNVIFSIDEEGNENQLTSSALNSFRPKLNARGNKVAFYRTVSGMTQLFTMDLDGSNLKQLTKSIPANSINNEEIGFCWADRDAAIIYPNFENLFKININGGDSQLIYTAQSGRYIMDAAQSLDRSKIAVLETNISGYEGSVYVVDASGALLTTVISGVKGAVGGVDISIDGNKVLYTHDISEFENENQRMLNSKVFLYDIALGTATNISDNKPNGTNDTDPSFSANEAAILLVNAPNNNTNATIATTVEIEEDNTPGGREALVENSKMPSQ